jgi:hypothetical protein
VPANRLSSDGRRKSVLLGCGAESTALTKQQKDTGNAVRRIPVPVGETSYHITSHTVDRARIYCIRKSIYRILIAFITVLISSTLEGDRQVSATVNVPSIAERVTLLACVRSVVHYLVGIRSFLYGTYSTWE